MTTAKKLLIALTILMVASQSFCQLSKKSRNFKKMKTFLGVPNVCLKEMVSFKFEADCVNIVISKGLSVGIVVGSFSLKVPQIMTMMKYKTATGLAYSSMVSETLLMVLSTGYNYHFGYPLTTYAEAIIILIQCLIILFLAFQYGQITFPQFAGAYAISLGLLSLYFLDLVPEQVYVSNQLISIALSRLPLNFSHYLPSAPNLDQLQREIHRCSFLHILHLVCWRRFCQNLHYNGGSQGQSHFGRFD